MTYLNTATYGLPPRRSWAELDLALAAYRAGRVNPPSYDRSVQRARSAFARLVDIDVAQVAVGAQVSSFVGLIAASLPAGSEVLTATGDFTSLLFPFHVQQARGSCRGAVRRAHRLVAFWSSPADGVLVHSASRTAAGSCSTSPAGLRRGRVDYTVCGGYKWLLGAAPRTSRCPADGLRPLQAGWYAGEDPWQRSTAGRCDSPVAPLRSLSGLAFLGRPLRRWRCWPRSTARRCRPTASDWRTSSGPAGSGARRFGHREPRSTTGPEALRAADIAAASRAGRLRLSFTSPTTRPMSTRRPHRPARDHGLTAVAPRRSAESPPQGQGRWSCGSRRSSRLETLSARARRAPAARRRCSGMCEQPITGRRSALERIGRCDQAYDRA